MQLLFFFFLYININIPTIITVIQDSIIGVECMLYISVEENNFFKNYAFPLCVSVSHARTGLRQLAAGRERRLWLVTADLPDGRKKSKDRERIECSLGTVLFNFRYRRAVIEDLQGGGGAAKRSRKPTHKRARTHIYYISGAPAAAIRMSFWPRSVLSRLIL